jgi:hypothetical protein
MLHSRMFFGGSFSCSPLSADSCPPDVSACAWMVGSHGLSPKLSPLFRSEVHGQRALEFQLSGSADKSAFCAKPRKISTSTKRARNSRRICTSLFIGLKADQNQHLQKNFSRKDHRRERFLREKAIDRMHSSRQLKMSFRRLIESNLSEGPLTISSVCVAPAFRPAFAACSPFYVSAVPSCRKASRMNTCAKMVGGTPGPGDPDHWADSVGKRLFPETQSLGTSKRRMIHGNRCGV